MKARILIPVGLLGLVALLAFLFFIPEDREPRGGGSEPGAQETQADQELELQEASEEGLLSVPAALDETSQREVVADQEPVSWSDDELLWHEVQVIFPEGTPVEEEAWLVAMEGPRGVAALHAPEGPIAGLKAGRPVHEVDGLLAGTRVPSDGLARLGLPPGVDSAWLSVAGNYVYSSAPKRIEATGTDRPELRPALGAWVSGQLLAPAGQPDLDLGQLEVKLRWALGNNLSLGSADAETLRRNTRTDAKGRFDFRAVPTGRTQSYRVEGERIAHGYGDDFQPESGKRYQTELLLYMGANITGRVVSSSGAPVEDAEVDALGRMFVGNPSARLRGTKTDADGRFELKQVTPGLTLIRVQSEGYKALVTKPFELLDGERRVEPDLELDEGLAVAGKLHFPDGTPASNAIVRIDADLSENLAGSAVSGTDYIGDKNTATVEADGSFRVIGAGPGPWSVSATLQVPEGMDQEAGLWATTQGVVHAPNESLELTLLEPIRIQGQVLDLDQQPIPTFEISAKRSGTQWYMPPSEAKSEAFQSEDGRFVMSDFRGGEWTFVASQEGYADSEEIKLQLPTEEPLSFTLQKPASLAGQVRGPNGRPVAGAEVSQELEGTQVFEAMQGRGDWPKVKSDELGNFLLEGIPPGSGSLLAKKDGFASSQAVPYDAAQGQAIEDLVLILREGGTISGEVFGTDGEPSAGCIVILQMPTLSERRIINTSAQGTFAEAGLTPGQWQVQALPGIASLQTDEGEAVDQATLIAALKMSMVTLADAETKHIVLGEPPANPVRVSGQVSAGESPLLSSIISFVPAAGGGMEALKLVPLDEDGRYELQLDEPGEYLITIQTTGQITRQASLEFRRSIPEEEEVRLDFELPLGRISGRVVGPDGAPRAGERVTLNMEGGLVFGTVFGGHYNETATDENGEFSIDYLRPGSYIVAAGGSIAGGLLGGGAGLGREVTTASVKEGQWVQGIDFELQEPGGIRGTVRDTSGAQVEGAAIFVRDEAGKLVELFSMAQTNASGSFEYPALAPGRYTVIARTETQTSSDAVEVEVVSKEKAEVTVVVGTGTLLLVTLIDRSGTGVPSRVSVLNEAGHEMNGMLGLNEIMERYNGGISSDVQRIGPVPPGSYRVRAFAEDGRSTERKVTARGNPERKIKLRLK